MLNARRLFFCIVWLHLSAAFIWAKNVSNYRWNYSLNLPATWLPESGNDGASLQRFRSADKRMAIEIRTWEKREAKSLNTIYTSHLQQLQGVGIAQRYRHMSHAVLLSRIEYYDPNLAKLPQTDLQTSPNLSAAIRIRGKRKTAHTKEDLNIKKTQAENNAIAYVFYFYGARYAYRVASIVARGAAPLERDIQQSVLDSFGFTGHNSWNWGPVSSFLIQQKPKNTSKPVVWQLAGHRFQTVRGPREAAEEQIALAVLERERRILASTSKRLYPYALQRFYTLNFRQNYPFFKGFATFLQRTYDQQAKEAQVAQQRVLPNYEYLLYDLQNMFAPSQTTEHTQLGLPSQALAKGTGNIETLALLYSILNSYFQNNTLILYANNMRLLVGTEQINRPKDSLRTIFTDPTAKSGGLKIRWYQNRYLLGELDAKVYIGWGQLTAEQTKEMIPLTFPGYRTPRFFP